MMRAEMWERIAGALEKGGFDLAGGFLVVEARAVISANYPPVDPDRVTVITVDEAMAGDKLAAALASAYSSDQPLTLHVDSDTTSDLTIGDLDSFELPGWALLIVPPREGDWGGSSGFSGLMESMATLLSPEGCPWDKKQTHESLLRYLQEEAYEYIDAVNAKDSAKMAEELGDLLLQIIFHAEIGRRDGEFTMTDVIRKIDAKLKRRHPHVWGDVDVNGDPEQVLANWGEIKTAERAENGEAKRESILDRVPKSLPALDQTHQYDALAASVGFDWDTLAGAIDKLREETAEVEEARTPEEQFGEVGDILFVSAVIARWLHINPEAALRGANKRFYQRFTYIERKAAEQGRTMKEMTLDEMEALWQEAKSKGIGI